jgi:glucosamine-6-phosphate deaminase
MRIYIEENYNALSEKASEIIADFIKEKPICVLGLATGSTPIKTYDLLGKLCKAGKISFKNVTTFNLDEYLGLSKLNSQSYHFFMEKNLFSKIDIDRKNIFFPTDLKDYKKYDEKIREKGGIDLQILGIGSNGHIGFNEPGSKFSSKTRAVLLAESTIKDNSRFFKNKKDVPKKAVTMGISTIMGAKKIILLANGANKQEAVLNALYSPVSRKNPASILQEHKGLIAVLDKEAAVKLK